MKTFAGNAGAGLFAGLVAALLLTLAVPADARVTTKADRTEMAMGETLRLTILADDGEQPDDIDLTALERNFRILQRSSATSARIVGGQQSVTRTLELELAPLRDGIVSIPGLTYGGLRTTPIAIKVLPQRDLGLDDALVYFEAKTDTTDVYVQAEVILTLTLQQAINLDNRAVSELDIPNTYVEPLEQRSYQRQAAGRLWQVTELRYALFPQQSGTLEIPALAFSGRELLPGRSLLGARLGRRIALNSDPITINVRPVPASFPGEVWLPAKRLTVSSLWSVSPDQLAVGDSTTRTLQMNAEGLQGSQLPPITSLSRSLSGLRFYPDQETIEQQEVTSGIEGIRQQSEALVATQPGTWTLPELRIPWWNTETDSLEYAVVDAVSVVVAGAATTDMTDPLAPVSGVGNTLGEEGGIPLLAWQIAGGAGWVLALVLGALLLRRPPTVGGNNALPSKPLITISSRDLLPLKQACSQNDPQAARDALAQWGRIFLGRQSAPTLTELAASVDQDLSKAIAELDRAIYGTDGTTWRGDQLFSLVRNQSDRVSESSESALALYPST